MLNKKNILTLADFIEKHTELKFDMDSARVPTECGTPGCIAGFAAALWPEARLRDGSWNEYRIVHLLGLNYTQCTNLFYLPTGNCGQSVPYSRIKRDVATATLRNLANTGAISFDV